MLLKDLKLILRKYKIFVLVTILWLELEKYISEWHNLWPESQTQHPSCQLIGYVHQVYKHVEPLLLKLELVWLIVVSVQESNACPYMIWMHQLTHKDCLTQSLNMKKLENAWWVWVKLPKMLLRSLESQDKSKTKWQYKVIKRLIKLKKMDFSNVNI